MRHRMTFQKLCRLVLPWNPWSKISASRVSKELPHACEQSSQSLGWKTMASGSFGFQFIPVFLQHSEQKVGFLKTLKTHVCRMESPRTCGKPSSRWTQRLRRPQLTNNTSTRPIDTHNFIIVNDHNDWHHCLQYQPRNCFNAYFIVTTWRHD